MLHDKSEYEIPAVAFDYCFMGERDAGHDNYTNMVGRDSKSRCYYVTTVPFKRVDNAEVATKRCLRILDFSATNDSY